MEVYTLYKVFIDTNLFLGLYETNKNNIEKIFDDILKIKDSIIFVDQVSDEFLRNRDILLEKQINNSGKNCPQIPTTALIRSLEEYSELEEAKRLYAQKNDKLVKKLKEIKDNLEKDIVYQKFYELYNNPNITKYNRTDEIIKKAYKRMLLGNPPIDDKKNTIGDQVIWETLISNLENDLIFITLDQTYRDHVTFLNDEFYKRTENKLIIHENVSFALTQIGIRPSNELLEAEKEVLEAEKSILEAEKETLMYQCPRCHRMISTAEWQCPYCRLYLD